MYFTALILNRGILAAVCVKNVSFPILLSIKCLCGVQVERSITTNKTEHDQRERYAVATGISNSTDL